MPKYGPYGTVGPARGFTWDEVRCNCGNCPLPTDEESRRRFRIQARALNALRGRVRLAKRVKRVRITVNSWYRCAAYNRRIGGATFSEHVARRATDIQVFYGRAGRKLPPHRVARLAALVWRFRKGGIGWYDQAHGAFTHVDHRPNGPARWVNG